MRLRSHRIAVAASAAVAVVAGLLGGTAAATPSGSAAPALVQQAVQPAAPSVQPAQLEQVFSDVPPGTAFYDEIMWLWERGITTGFDDGTFRPWEPINRDAMAAFLYRFAGSPAYDPPDTSPFTDMDTTVQFYREIMWLRERGITTGFDDGGYHPWEPINRDAMAAFMYRYAGEPAYSAPAESPFTDIGPGDMFYEEICWLRETGITTGFDDGGYHPWEPINRDAMAAFLYRLNGYLNVNEAPFADAGPDQAVGVGAEVRLDGTASTDGDGDPLTFRWVQESGPAVTLAAADTATPTFTAADPGDHVFSLVVNDGAVDAPADTVIVTATAVAETNVARTARPTVTASEEDLEVKAYAQAAVDGSPRGWPGNPTREWATIRQRAGAWIQLTWPVPVTIDRVVLYDRPNADDRVRGGRLTFSDGSSVTVGSLDNAGGATEVTFTSRTVTSLRFAVTSVSSSTYAAGLAEIEVLGVEHPAADAGVDQRVALGSEVTLDGSASTGGSPLSFAWQQAGGTGVALRGATTDSPSFVATEAGTFTFELTTHVGALTSVDAVTVTVIDPATNQAPDADAGADQAVAVGGEVALDGTGSSDLDGHPLSWAWTQTGGPVVELEDADTAAASFAAGLTGEYVFQLEASDGLLVDTDDVVVTVTAGGVLTLSDSGMGALASADFPSGLGGETAWLQVQAIATSMTDEVTVPAWRTIATGSTNASGDVTFTVSDPLEVAHQYRAIADPTGVRAVTDAVTYAAPRPTIDTGLPTIYLNTNEGGVIDTRYLYLEGTFSMTAGSLVPQCGDVDPVLVKTKGRGHSTWEMPKKPFNFNLDKKLDLCGLGKEKKYALLANADDLSLLRNSVAMYLGSQLTNMAWVPDMVPVELVLNGEHMGSYVLAERIGVSTNRVDIDELEDNQGGANDNPPEVTGGYLLEWDFRTSNEHNFMANDHGWVGIKEPEDEDDGSGITDVQVDWIDSHVDHVDSVLFGPDFTDDAEGWQKYIDAASAVDYYLIMELTKPDDGNMYTSVFMYKERDPDPLTPGDQGKLFLGPMWDFDCALGLEEWAFDQDYPGDYQLPTGWYMRDENLEITLKQADVTWFNRLNEDPDFQAMVAARWQEVLPALQTSDDFLAAQAEVIADSAEIDVDMWAYEKWPEEVDYLRDWLQTRIAWMDAQY